MNNAETLRRLERIEELIRPLKISEIRRTAIQLEIKLFRDSLSAASSDEPSCHIGIGKGEGDE